MRGDSRLQLWRGIAARLKYFSFPKAGQVALKLSVQAKVSGKTNRRKYDADYNASVNIARRDLALLAGLSNPARRGLQDEPTKLPTLVVE